MSQTFKADGHPMKRVLYSAKLLLPLVLLIAAHIALGWPGWLATSVGATVGFAVTALALVGRGTWGNQIEFRPESLTLFKAGKERFYIPSKAITALRTKPDSIAIAWLDGARRKSVVIGREYFADQSWEQLCEALSTLATRNPDGSSQPEGA